MYIRLFLILALSGLALLLLLGAAVMADVPQPSPYEVHEASELGLTATGVSNGQIVN